MNDKFFASLTLCLLAAASMPAFAQWSTQQTLATNAYNGSVTIDSAGNRVSAWYQNALPNGTAVNEVWASTAAFGRAWSTPVNVSGPIGVASGTPSVRGSASGNATVVYSTPSLGGTYADHPSGGTWTAPATMNGVNQFYVINDNGDEGLAWGTGGARPTSSTINAVVRPAHGVWSVATTIFSAPHLALDGALVAPDGSTAVVWESFDSTCGSRTCKTSNWVLRVSTHAPGAQSWVTSGTVLGPDATQHFGQLAADTAGDLGVIAISGSNVVSVVRHAGTWGSAVVVAPLTSLEFYTGTGRDNRIYASDSAGHATVVGWGNPQLSTLVAVDGNLTTNTWGKVTTISGSDQQPNYFDFAMSSTGTAITFWSVAGNGGNTIWRAATRTGPGVPWNAPATAGTSFEGGGTPEGVAINGAGRAAVVFHGYSSDFTTYIQYTNTYQP
jgi:hypothetical protein